MPDDVPVIVVGAGPAGLSTAGALGRVGIRATVLERDSEVGARWAERYDRLRLHTIRRFSGLAHHPLPRELGRYVAKDEFARYLRAYVVRFGLDVRLDTDVSRIRADGDGWVVEAPAAALRAPIVVVATGKYDAPVVPEWPGRETFRGSLVHSSGYRSGADYAGQVCWSPASGTLVRRSRPTSWNRARIGLPSRPNLASDNPPGRRRHPYPAARNGSLRAAASSRRPDRVGATAGRDRRPQPLRPRAGRVGAVHRQAAADHRRWLPTPAPRTARRDPARRRAPDRARVGFADGRSEPFDAVVAATGYRSTLADLVELDGEPARAPAGGAPWGAGLPHGLYVIGLRETVRGDLFETRRDSLALARKISRDLASQR